MTAEGGQPWRATLKQGAQVVGPSSSAGMGPEEPAWLDRPPTWPQLLVLLSQPSQHWQGDPSSLEQWIEALGWASQPL